MTTMRDHALYYARRGWPVFPCKPRSKEPATPHGFQDATTDEGQIVAWWTATPDANIGLACEAAGVDVVDDDPRHGGDESLEELEERLGKLPTTPVSLTGGGGTQQFFRGNGRRLPSKASTFGLPGIDTRGRGGYVVLPPSIHPSGRPYAWNVEAHPDDMPLATLPDRWYDAATTRTTPPADSSANKIKAGVRDQTLTSIAGTMRRRGMSEAAILAALTAENAARCEPPLSDYQVAKIVRSIMRPEYAPPADTPQDATTTEIPTGPRIVLMGDLLRTEPKPIDWVVSGLVARGKASGLAAKRKSGKSKVTHQAIVDIAAERPYALGHEPFRILAHGPVFWIDLEQGEDELRAMSHRLLAGGDYTAAERRRIDEGIVWVPRGSRLNFGEPRTLTWLQHEVETRGAVLVVVDSLSGVQAFYGSENDNSGRRRLYNEVIAPLLDIGAAVLCFGHTAIAHKDADSEVEIRTRGGGDVLGTMDSNLYLIGTSHVREHGDTGRVIQATATLGAMEGRGSTFDRCRVVLDGLEPRHDEIPGPLRVYAEPIVPGIGQVDVTDVLRIARGIAEAVAEAPRFRSEVCASLGCSTRDHAFREALRHAVATGLVVERQATTDEATTWRSQHTKGGKPGTVLEHTE